MSEKATLTLRGKSYEFPVIEGSEHEVAIDISTLRSASGAITIDEAFGNTGACKSAVTFIDGDEGILRYRGYPIEQLAEKSNFLEVAYLLVNGHLPEKTELESFQRSIVNHTLLHEDMKTFFDGLPTERAPDGHPVFGGVRPVDVLPRRVEPALQDRAGPGHHAPDRQAAHHRGDVVPQEPRPAGHVSGQLTVVRRQLPAHDVRLPDGALSHRSGHRARARRALHPARRSRAELLHVDGARRRQRPGQPLRLDRAGICALWGPLHGGANQEVLEMLERIHQDGGDREDGRRRGEGQGQRLQAHGLRPPGLQEPRPARPHHQDARRRRASRLGINDPLLDIARRLEEAALSDSYFVERKLYPNVDFYSGIIYRALGFPTDMFTVLFALGRLPGWIAQWKEMNEQGSRITRPRQVYTGETVRDYPG
jgi:citrate synthase